MQFLRNVIRRNRHLGSALCQHVGCFLLQSHIFETKTLDIMDQLRDAFIKKGLTVPVGLMNLIRNGPNKKFIYKKIWAAARFGGNLGGEGTTFTFPQEVRIAVRSRFPEEDTKHYDGQYSGKPGVYHLSLEELSKLPYPRQ